MKYLVAVKYLETLRDIASGQEGKVVYLPYESAGMLGAVGAVKDLMAGGKLPGA